MKSHMLLFSLIVANLLQSSTANVKEYIEKAKKTINKVVGKATGSAYTITVHQPPPRTVRLDQVVPQCEYRDGILIPEPFGSTNPNPGPNHNPHPHINWNTFGADIECPLPPGHVEHVENRRKRRRRLQDVVTSGPCAGFASKAKAGTCGNVPALHVGTDAHGAGDLSTFAHEWISYSCCEILTEPMPKFVASVWLWLQVCTTVMDSATPDSYRLDKEFNKKHNTSYMGGPLENMKMFCPRDLDGGELSEWTVTSFFPTLQNYNPHFMPLSDKEMNEDVAKCNTTESTGAVTILLEQPGLAHEFGHLSMVVHDDHELALPGDHNKAHYVSFSAGESLIGPMLTGTKSRHDGFGTNVEDVTHVLTLYNVDTDAVLKKWDNVKKRGQMYDLMNWNCARAVIDVLNAGYPNCKAPNAPLWTPVTAFAYLKRLQSKINSGIAIAGNSGNNVRGSRKTVSLAAVHSRQIKSPPSGVSSVSVGVISISVGGIIAIALVTFFGTLLLVTAVHLIGVMRARGKAKQQLDKAVVGKAVEL